MVVTVLNSPTSIFVWSACSCVSCSTVARPYVPYVQWQHCSDNLLFQTWKFVWCFLAIEWVQQTLQSGASCTGQLKGVVWLSYRVHCPIELFYFIKPRAQAKGAKTSAFSVTQPLLPSCLLATAIAYCGLTLLLITTAIDAMSKLQSFVPVDCH